jgi:hypothetical protein
MYAVGKLGIIKKLSVNILPHQYREWPFSKSVHVGDRVFCNRFYYAISLKRFVGNAFLFNGAPIY